MAKHERELSAREHQRKAQILTQPEPAKVRKNEGAIVLKQGSLFLLSTDSGDVPWTLPHGFGLFYEDCRFLDGYTLTLNGQAPTVLSSDDVRGFETLHHLTNPELSRDGGGCTPRNTVVVHRNRLIRGRVLHERITVQNFGPGPARLQIELRFRARFEDLFILKGFVSGPRGALRRPRIRDDSTVELGYDGRDGRVRTTTLVFSSPPHRLEPECATFAWTVEPGGSRHASLSITPSVHPAYGGGRRAAQPRLHPRSLARWPSRSEAIWLTQTAEVQSSNEVFDLVMRRALMDLHLLRSSLSGCHYFAAGIPWFVTLFGRDAATVAIQTMPYGFDTARETLALLARFQAKHVDPYRDAEPGKILHEFRSGELARMGAIPQSPAYYGAVDATLLFLILLAEYVNWSGDLALARELRPNIDAALQWMVEYGDHDGDGYLDYVGRYENGLINQGWKDAGNSIVNADGSMVEPPVALCEVQAYAFRALRQTAGLLRMLGDQDRADQLDARAGALRERFERDFWSEDLGCYVLARQRDGRPAAVVSSNTGQVLWGGIASPERAARVAARLLDPDMFSGWGVRTLSSEAAAYNPVSYHLGSVWPHDNGLIIAGLRRYGQDEPALRLFDALLRAASSFRDFRLPELFCGFPRDGSGSPVRYPVACSPQAWAAGALPHAMWNLLGLRADSTTGRLRVVRPRLPLSMEWLELRGLRAGAAVVDLRFERKDETGRAAMQASVREGSLRIEAVDEPSAPDEYR